MTEKQAEVELAKISVQEAQLRARAAEMALNEGFKRLKVKFDLAVQSLRTDLEQSKLELAREEVLLKQAEAALEKGFES